MNSAAFNNYKKQIGSKKIWLGMLFLNLMTVPFYIINILTETKGSYSVTGINSKTLIAFGFVGLLGIFIAAMALYVFDYLYQKTKIDMAMGLPMTKRHKFISDYLAGLTYVVVPFLFQIVVTTLLMISFHKRFYDYVGDTINDAIIVRIYFIGLLVIIFLYTLSVLVVTCTGSLFEAVTGIIYTNILTATSYYIVVKVLLNDLFGVSDSNGDLSSLFRSSPVGGLAYGLYQLNINRQDTLGRLFSWAAVYLLVMVVVFIVSYFMYQKRKAEQVSTPYVSHIFFYIVGILITFHVAALTIDMNVISCIVTSSVVYFIFEVVSHRGFRKVQWMAIRYVGIFSLVFLSILVIQKSEGFGAVHRVASVEQLKSVDIRIGLNEIENKGEFQELYKEINEGSDISVSETPLMKKIIEVQKAALKRYDENPELAKKYDFEGNVGDVNITYHNKDGSSMSRYYQITEQDWEKLLPLYVSESVASTKVGRIESNHVGNQDISLKSISLKNSGVVLSATLSVELIKTLKSDIAAIKNVDYDQVLNQCKMKIKSGHTVLYILPQYTQTIQLLKQNKLWVE